MIFKKQKKIMTFLIRSFFSVLLFNLLVTELSKRSQSVSFHTFMNKGLLTLFSVDGQGNWHLDFVKTLIVLCTFVVGFYDTILCMGDLSEQFNQVIKYYSRNRWEYLIRKLKIVCHFFKGDCLVWLVSFMSLFYYHMIVDYMVLVFWIVNLLAFLVGTLVMKQTLFVAIYSSVLFMGQQWLFQNLVISVFCLLTIFVVSFTRVFSQIRGDES